ncbi:MAG: Asp-tRNA(Asn)/Glu-tRNA(Gln) amidotransferase subunit GatA [Geopsychrobacter sp.]|nr:Asp-tRNA(Asn)/Glu-tRNA(Gln) amidotransferase subunit GatA [Geopsychrobacter sp.]
MDISQMNIRQLQQALRDGETSALELTRVCLARIAAGNEQLNAFVTVCEDAALAAAAEADRKLAAGQGGPLTGIPIAVKDIFNTQGVRTSCGSRMLENYIAPYDATAFAKLKEQGAILLGKLNMDEFAMGSSSENSASGVVRNPWDTERVPGGSSGGSAAALAAGQAVATLGTDTGGSIRQPASFCGVVGVKPTYGRVSRYGVIAYASSLDQVGPLAHSVEDAALLLGMIAGYDAADSTSVDCPVPDYLATLNQGVKGLKIGLPQEYFIEGLNPAVKQAVDAAIEVYRGLGAEIVPVSLPHTDYAVACYYLIATAEASSNLARYDGVRFGQRESSETGGLVGMYEATRAAGFGAEVKRRIMLGTYALSSGYYDAYYLKAQKVRTLIREDFTRVFEQVDLLLTPVAPTAAFKIGEKTDDPLQMYLSDIFTIPVNLAGTCALSLPCGMDGQLPIGLQLIGKPFAEATILQAAQAFESETDWHQNRPNI